MGSSMTLEEAMQELQKAKEEVRRAVDRWGIGILTNATWRDWGTALRIGGNKKRGVWITTSPNSDAPELSDEEAARLIMERNERFGKITGVFRLEDESDIDAILDAAGFGES